jgi:hypothetical protein
MEGTMSLETAIFVTTFAILGARLLISGNRDIRSAAEREHKNTVELDALFRPVLLFTTTAPVARC